jgi:prevent-host-death family protein
MSKTKEYYVSTSEAQANISKMMQFIEKEGDRFIITRYSKPTAVILPFDEYKDLIDLAKQSKGLACRNCNL